tara:strand:+ start:403 stop:2661 length:2259 start_codon:yes stop_codon:yes gene_type:complete
MKKNYYTLTILFIFYLNINAQDKIDTAYSKYFENTREVIHLHLNKTTFLEGEEIWFQAYVIEQNSNKLHPTTSNLYVSIFDDEGKLKDQHLIEIKKGIGQGNILLDSSFIKNSYYLKASTKWMKNFNESNSFTQKIELITNQRKTQAVSKNEDDFFDFQVFPESGYFIENIKNNGGILIKDKSGKGQKIVKGTIKEKNTNKIVGSFFTNSFGLGELTFNYEEDKQYSLEATLDNGTILNKNIPIAKQRGVTMQVKNPNAQFLEVSLLTNSKTLKEIENLNFKIWIHNTSTFYKNSISFQKNELIKTLLVKNDKLSKGINIITVFDENNKPLLERLIFNYHPDLFFKPEVTSRTILKDSISTIIKNPTNKKIYVSASFLPTSTKAYNPDNNIVSSFFLKPFIKGNIQNVDYYFKNINRKKLNELDLLLLTQGWSKYDWNNIFKKPPINNFEFENGIDVTVNLNNSLKKNQSILAFSEDNIFIKEIQFNEMPYTIKNSFFKKNSAISFTLKNDNTIKVNPIVSYSNSTILENLSLNEYSNFGKIELIISNFDRLTKETEVLKGIFIKSKIKNTNPLASSFRKVNLEDGSFSGKELVDLISVIWDKYKYTDFPLKIFYLNSENITYPLWEYLDIPIEEIREVREGHSIFGKTSEIHVFTKDPKVIRRERAKLTKITIPVGFSLDKQYYEPKYPSFTSDTYKYYGAIYWKPNLVIDANSEIKFNIPANYQKEMRVFIEGISEESKLFSEELVLKVD